MLSDSAAAAAANPPEQPPGQPLVPPSMPPSAPRRQGQGASLWRDSWELLASMRFAIALLTLICIASVIGTVIKQQEPYPNYVNQFGPFWAELFGAVGLYTVYSAWWFLLILGFLVLSTSLCIARQTPKILSDLKSYKEDLRASALRAFHHKAEGWRPGDPAALLDALNPLLRQGGWQARAQIRPDGTMVAARKGMAHKIGYLAAHSAIVLVCLGGLLDGELVVRAQMALQGKTPYAGGGLLSEVPAEHRLSAANPTYRGNLFVPEGARAGTAVLTLSDGALLQPLPFDIELKKFRVEYYETGMPKLFASEVLIHDRDSGQVTPATIKVNEPLIHRGVAVYQSSFDDGGSLLKLRAHPLRSTRAGFDLQGTVGGSVDLKRSPVGAATEPAQTLKLEFTGLRVINVENLNAANGAAAGGSGADVRAVDLAGQLQQHLGSGAKGDKDQSLRNIGPSFSYKLRDAAGQAREFNNYMLPVELDGKRVLLAGVRDSPSEPLRYLRIPVDEHDSAAGWLRLQADLSDAALRAQAVARYVAKAVPADRPEMAEQLGITARRALAMFAGAEPPLSAADAARVREVAPGGLQALAQFIELSVPEAERARVSEVMLRIVNGGLFELTNLGRERAGLAALQPGAATEAFMSQAVLSLSDAIYYPAPVLLQLTDFQQVQASVFQVARAPGKTLVYLGAVLLIIGVLAMLYIRERRLWIWLTPAADGQGTRLQLALSTTRRTLDADAEFERLRQSLLPPTPTAASTPPFTPPSAPTTTPTTTPAASASP